MQMVARAAPDGYTIVLGYIANLGIGPSLYDKMPYVKASGAKPE